MKEYIKSSETELLVVETEEVVRTSTHDLDTLKYQEGQLLSKIDGFNQQKQAELAAIRELIGKCADLGIVSSEAVEPETVGE